MDDVVLDSLVLVLAAFAAGIIRGFTGFGGPAFLVAILTIFYVPLDVLGKIFVIDLFTSIYLFRTSFQHTDWKLAAYLILPTIMTMPVGQWILLNSDQYYLRYAIALIIACCSTLLLLGFRYKKPPHAVTYIAIGAVAGVVFGATYIALVAVVAILAGPLKKDAARALIITWALAAALTFAAVSFTSGTTRFSDIWIALPGAVAYFLAAMLGARWFVESAEWQFRQVALISPLILSLIALVV